MPKFKVRWLEQIYHTAEVEADSPADAYDQALNCDNFSNEVIDGPNYVENSFYILDEVKDADTD